MNTHEMTPMMIAGIDLAWNGDRNPSAIAFGRLTSNALAVTELTPAVCGMETILHRLISEPDLQGIAIDASLIIENQSGQRPCEKSIGRAYGSKGACCHATNLTLYPSPFSVELSQKLQSAGYRHLAHSKKWQIECYPHPAIIEIFGLQRRLKYKKGTAAEKRSGQRQLASHIRSLQHSTILSLDVPEKQAQCLSTEFIDNLKGARLKENEDALDAVICLYIAGLYARSTRHLIFGDTQDGYIYVPRQQCI